MKSWETWKKSWPAFTRTSWKAFTRRTVSRSRLKGSVTEQTEGQCHRADWRTVSLSRLKDSVTEQTEGQCHTEQTGWSDWPTVQGLPASVRKTVYLKTLCLFWRKRKTSDQKAQAECAAKKFESEKIKPEREAQKLYKKKRMTPFEILIKKTKNRQT